MATTRASDDAALERSRAMLLADSIPVGISIGVYGLAFGVAAIGAGLTTLEAAAMSALVFAGAAQFSSLTYLAAGAPLLPVTVTITAAPGQPHSLTAGPELLAVLVAIAPVATTRKLLLGLGLAVIVATAARAVGLP